MRNEKAFTLVEVILAIGVFAIIAIPIISMFLDSIKVTSKSENTSEAYAYAQQYVEKLKGGDIVVANVSNVAIPNTEYTYSINVNSTTEEVANDGEDFYKGIKTEGDMTRQLLEVTNVLNQKDGEIFAFVKASSRLIYLEDLDYIEINNNFYWKFWFEGDDLPEEVYLETPDIWIKYTNLSIKKTLRINNKSGSKVNIYLYCTDEGKKENLKIKNLEGVINVYGPITEIPTERGRKKTSNVTVTVKNIRTEEHAELVANVIHY